MGLRIGIGTNLRIQGAFNWIRYWLTRYPSLLTATTISSTRIDLAWTNNGAVDYNGVSIERSTDGINYAEIDTIVPGAAYSDITCAANTLYYYRIRYYRGTHYSAYSNVVSGTTWTAQYQTVYDSFTTKPSAAIAAAQNTMVAALVAAGVWTKLDVLYIFAQTTNGAGEALKNWKLPGTYDATLVNAPAFVALEGFTGAATKYIRTNWNPNSNGVNYTLDSAFGAIYIRTNVKENSADFGAKDATHFAAYLATRWISGVDGDLYGRINTSVSSQIANTDSRGMFVISRETNNIVRVYRNKAQIIDAAVASSIIPNKEMYILCYNNNGVADFLSTKQVSFYAAGAKLLQADVNSLTDAFEVYMDSNGKGVIA